LAWIKRNSGDFSGAQADASESQRVVKIAGNLYMEASALHTEAVSLQNLGSYTHSISLLDRATHLLDLCGLSGGAVHFGIITCQAEAHRYKSEYTEALSIQTRMLQDCSSDQIYKHGLIVLNIAQIGLEIGGSQHDVQQNISTAGNLFQKINDLGGLLYCDMFRAALEVQQGSLLVGRNLFQKCLKSAWGKDTEVVTYCLERLGVVQHWGPVNQGSCSAAVTFFAHSMRCKQRLEVHRSFQFLGDVYLAQGDQETAISLFTAALDGFTQMDVHRSKAECMVRLGDISELNGDQLKAVELWETARSLFERSSQSKQLAQLDAKLASLQGKQETLSFLPYIHAPTEHLERFSIAKSLNSPRIPQLDDVSFEDDKALGSALA
jgi:tetratricopeptide (TPR) repeat protein